MAPAQDNCRCRGPLDRRTWLKVGGLSLGALSVGASPRFEQLSVAQERGAAAGFGVDPEFSVILFWANGGPSHIDTFDMKPDAPAEYRGPFRPIRSNVPGLEITELLPKLASMADRFTLVRSLQHNRNE